MVYLSCYNETGGTTMLKKSSIWTVVLLSVLMLLTACATPNTSTQDQSAAPEQTQGENLQTQDNVTDNQTAETLSTQDQEKVTAMLPVLDSIILAMNDSGTTFEPRDEEFFWSVLYYVAVNYTDKVYMAELTDDALIKVPSRSVQEIATACFADYDDLLNIPESLVTSVTYDADWDAYMFTPSDRGMSSSEITEMSKNGDTINVTVVLDGVDTYKFTLVDNPYVESIESPTFYYSVTSAK